MCHRHPGFFTFMPLQASPCYSSEPTKTVCPQNFYPSASLLDQDLVQTGVNLALRVQHCSVVHGAVSGTTPPSHELGLSCVPRDILGKRAGAFGAGSGCRSRTPLDSADTVPALKPRLCGNETATDFSQARNLLHV